jgi:hypothetical protein
MIVTFVFCNDVYDTECFRITFVTLYILLYVGLIRCRYERDTIVIPITSTYVLKRVIGGCFCDLFRNY